MYTYLYNLKWHYKLKATLYQANFPKCVLLKVSPLRADSNIRQGDDFSVNSYWQIWEVTPVRTGRNTAQQKNSLYTARKRLLK